MLFRIMSSCPPCPCRMNSLLGLLHRSFVHYLHDVLLSVGHQAEHRQEILLSQNGNPGRRDCADRGVSRCITDQGYLSEVLAGRKPGDYRFDSVFFTKHRELAVMDEIGTVAFFTLSKNHLPWFDIFDHKQAV